MVLKLQQKTKNKTKNKQNIVLLIIFFIAQNLKDRYWR